MPSRLAARLITGPLGFFLAGAVDMSAAWGGYALGRLRARLAGTRTTESTT